LKIRSENPQYVNKKAKTFFSQPVDRALVLWGLAAALAYYVDGVRRFRPHKFEFQYLMIACVSNSSFDIFLFIQQPMEIMESAPTQSTLPHSYCSEDHPSTLALNL
jgi:hypothetical protein